MSAETPLAKMERLVHELAHEINLAQGIECNDRAKQWIRNHLTKIRNENEMKWNELGVWLIDNTEASVADINEVRKKINRGEAVRGYRTEASA